ncbi:MAG: aspartate aminotransferase family protein [Anaerolineales bacterium]|nr:aspartate aminotransferase family protein [Anaerolineales bacterium]
MTKQDTATWIEKDRKQLHPTYHPKSHANPLVIERGKGVWLYTTDGEKILDGMAGLWNVNAGYGREELAKAAYDQMKDLAFTSNFSGMTNLPSIQLADKLAGFAYEGLNTTFFTSGGSEANDSAFKTARYYWKRKGKPGKYKVIARKGSYHGITLAATFATGLEKYHTMFGPAPDGFVHIPAPNPYRYEGDVKTGETIGQAAARELEEAILREGQGTVAAFIAEPVMGVGGVIVPPADYFPLVRAICDKYEILFIADEVITGFGRTGEWFAVDNWDVTPDIITTAKGITSGYVPLGAVIVSEKIAKFFDSHMLSAGLTYNGHALACATALATIEVYEEEKIFENVKKVGKYLGEQLEDLKKKHVSIGDVRYIGLFTAMELVKNRETKVPMDLTALKNFLVSNGVYVFNFKNILFIVPPLTITKEQLDEGLKLIDEGLAELMDKQVN